MLANGKWYMSSWKFWKIRFQHVHMRKLDRNRKNRRNYLVCSTHKPQWAVPQVKGIWGPHEAKRKFLTSASQPCMISKLDLSCCSTDYAVNPAWSKSWVICVADRTEGTMCTRTYLILYYLPCTLLALCSKWSTDNYLCPEWKFIECYKTPLNPN